MMPLATYWDMLDAHDWYYPFTDAGLTYRLGEAIEHQLIEIAKQSAAHKQLFDDFHRHHYSGNAFNEAKYPKPAKPAN